MGAVIAAHRQKLGWTQDYLAIVCDVDKQTVVYWESLMYLADMDRRVFLCKLLKIFPPALLGLTWRSIIDEEHTEAYITAFEHIAELLFENTYGLYEELLAFGYEGVDNKGVSPEMAYRFQKHQEELEKIVSAAPTEERDQWIDLLGRFYQLSTCIAQQHQNFDDALTFANKAVEFALSVEDAELRGSALYRRARVHLVQCRTEQARQDITDALEYAKSVRNPLTGSIHLLAAEVNSLYAKDDEKLRKQCVGWQNRVVNALYNRKIEADGSFIRLNLSAVHHERAKTFLRFALFHTSDEELLDQLRQPHIRPDTQHLKEAQNAMILAWENLQSGYAGWEKNFLITEAKVQLVNRDVEASAKTAKKAFNLATVLHSQKVKGEVRGLYQLLSVLDEENPYVRNLGVALGIY
jgi:DNA-binding XRE family transcriptional regulator